MALPEEYAGEQSKVAILPVPFEKDVTYGQGANKGPEEIIRASQYLEYYDDELDSEPFEQGIQLMGPLHCADNPQTAHDQIVEHAAKFTGRFIIGIGGDHSITSGFVEALSKEHENLSVLILDAHADLRYSWKNSKWNHACVARRIAAKHKVGIIGVRAMDKYEKKYADNEDNVKIVKAYAISEESIKKVLAHLTDKVFISIDVDVFDPSFIRNTGTPEPGGLGWYDVLNILKRVFDEKNVVGADVVEFAPQLDFRAEAFALAKLVYKLAAYRLWKEG